MEVVTRHRESFLNRFIILIVVSVISILIPVFSSAADPAPISEDIVKSVLQQRAKGSSSPSAIALVQQLEDTITFIRALDRRTSGNSPLSTADTGMLDAKRLEIESVKLDVWNHFAKVRAKLETLELKGKVKAWNNKQDKIEARFDKLQSALKAITNAKGRKQQKKAIKNANRILSSIYVKFKDKQAVPDPRPLPTLVRPQPTSIKPSEEKATAPEYLASLPAKPTMYAMLDGVIISDVAPPVTPAEATSCNYTPEDLAETLDVKITPEIQALAKQLEYSPAKIFEYVNNEIKFYPYYGSLKGSQGTLISDEGNATDHASLLIALLRASKIPARYVKGVANFLGDQRLTNWLGVKSYAAAEQYLTLANIPAALGTTAAGDEYVLVQHTWVEACVPYGNYRGTGVDKSGHRWIPLDASFKQYEYQDGIPINVTLDYANYLSARTDTLPYERFEALVEQAIKLEYANFSLQDVPYTGPLKPSKFDILPASLPYAVNSFTPWVTGGSAEVAELPDSHRYKYHLTVKDSANNPLGPTLTLNMPEIALDRVTLSFKPASAADQTIYDSWSGSQSDLPASVVNVLPVIKVEGIERQVGDTSINLGAGIRIIKKLTLPEFNTSTPTCPGDVSGTDPDPTCLIKRIASGIKAGAYLALRPDAMHASDRYLQQRSKRLLDKVNNGSTDLDETLGEFLHIALSKYYRYVNDVTRDIGGLNGFPTITRAAIGSTSSDLNIQPLFDLPFGMFAGGLYIDVLASNAHLDPVTGSTDFVNDDRLWEATRLTLYAGSAYEHYIWQENAHIDAVSTVRGLQYANETGIPVLTLDSTNIANYDTLMDASMAPYKTAISNLVSDGATVTVPKSTFSYSVPNSVASWDGAVWMAENRTAGKLFAIISGGLNGGYGITLDAFSTSSAFEFTSDYNFFAPPVDSSLYSLSATQAINSNGNFGIDLTFNNDLYFSLFADFQNNFIDSIELDLGLQQLETIRSLFNSGPANFGINNYTNLSGDPVNVATGNMVHSERDIEIKGRGLPFVFERFYNSATPKDGPLGFGWTHSFNHRLVFLDNNYNGIEDANDNDGVSSVASWVDGTGGVKYFGVSADANGVPADTQMTNAPGYYLQAKKNADGTYTLQEKNGLTYTFESLAGTLGQTAKLMSIRDRNNNTLTLNYTGELLTSVSDNLGRAITFTYNAEDRIAELSDWSGRTYQYNYDTNGDLIEFKNPLAVADQQAPVTYSYYDGLPLSHAMQSYTMPNGNSMTFEYYSNRKMFRHFNNLGETMTFTYNIFRGETVVVNERGYAKKYFFDENGSATKTIEENGSIRTYTYADPSNPFNKTRERDPLGYPTDYEYDVDGNLVKTTNPSGSTVEYSYFNEFSQAQKVKDANGNYTMYKFNGQGNRTETIRFKQGIGSNIDPTIYTPIAADIIAWTISTYDAYGNPLTVKQVRDFNSRDGPTVAYDFNDVVNGVDGLNAVNQKRTGDKNGDGAIAADEFDTADLTYDALGRTLQGTNNWYPTQTEYDALGRVVRRSDAYGHLRDIRYDANNNVVGQKLELSGKLIDQSSVIYDEADRRTSSTNAGGFTTYYQYDEVGNVIKTTNPDNYTIGFEYDGNNRLIKAFDAEGNAVTRTLDLTGKIRTETDPNGNTTIYQYYAPNKEGRLYRQYDARDRFTEFDYDANGNVIRVTDTLGRTTLAEYDALNQPVRIVGPVLTQLNLRQVTKYTYDNLGNRIQVAAGATDASGTNPASDAVTVQMSSQYDDFGRVIKQTDPLNRVWTYEYDNYGNLVKATDAKNQVTNFTYNYGGQLATRTDHDGNVTSISYNALGQPATVSSANVTYTYEYDAAHRRVRTSDSRGNKQMDYGYSPGGLLNGKSDNEGNQTDYFYDPVGRLTGIWAPNGDLVTYVYDAGGRLSEKRLPNGVDTQYRYNPDNTLATVLNSVNATEISRHDYGYDAVGQRETLTETIKNTTKDYKYLYDELNRLTEVQDNATATPIESYGYDMYNNRETRTSAAGTEVYLHDAAQQLNEIRQDTTAGALIANFNYDANGNMDLKSEAGVTTILAHDALDRITQVSQSGKPTQNYAYDQGNRRLQKTVGTAVTNYLYEGDSIVGEYGADWTLANAIYTHGAGIDAPMSRDTDGLAEYYHQDGINSVVAMTDMVGNVSGSARYDAYGNTIEQTGSVPLYGYTGREPDATGLIYYRARYYDPRIGRFTQADPAGFIDGINRYTYALNNPVNYTDPSGLFGFDPRTTERAFEALSYVYNSSTGNPSVRRNLINEPPLTRVGAIFSGIEDGLISGFVGLGNAGRQVGRRIGFYGESELQDSKFEDIARDAFIDQLFTSSETRSKTLDVAVDTLEDQFLDPYLTGRVIGRASFSSATTALTGLFGIFVGPIAASGDAHQALEHFAENNGLSVTKPIGINEFPVRDVLDKAYTGY